MSKEFYARCEDFNDSLLIYVREKSHGGGTTRVIAPLQCSLVEVAEGSFMEPTVTLRGDDGRQLFQAMWDAGMRPNNGAGSGAEAQALKDHVRFAERMADGLLARAK